MGNLSDAAILWNGDSHGRHWRLLAAHVRSNHVHVVVSAERDPGRIMSDMKGRASRDLNRAGFDDGNRRRWARHGSTRYLFRDDKVAAAIRYTLDGQGERMAYYDGRKEERSATSQSDEPRTK